MSGALVTAIALALALCAGAGLFVGAMRAAQSPAFYAGVVKMIVDLVLPEIFKRMPEQREAVWRDGKLTGGDTFKRQGGR